MSVLESRSAAIKYHPRAQLRQWPTANHCGNTEDQNSGDRHLRVLCKDRQQAAEHGWETRSFNALSTELRIIPFKYFQFLFHLSSYPKSTTLSFCCLHKKGTNLLAVLYWITKFKGAKVGGRGASAKKGRIISVTLLAGKSRPFTKEWEHRAQWSWQRQNYRGQVLMPTVTLFSEETQDITCGMDGERANLWNGWGKSKYNKKSKQSWKERGSPIWNLVPLGISCHSYFLAAMWGSTSPGIALLSVVSCQLSAR